MTDKPKNPQAFPNSVQPDFQYANEGMTLRDYFAGQALMAIITRAGTTKNSGATFTGAAYEYADHMLEARAKK